MPRVAAHAATFRSDSGFQMLLQARHQLDEVARPEAVVELVHEDAFPGVAAGAGGAGQGEQIGAAGDPGRRTALDRRGADLLVAEPAEQLAKAGNLLLIDAVERFRRNVPAGNPGAAGRDHDVDVGVGDPLPELRNDLVLLIAYDVARGNLVAGGAGELGERVAGP